MAVAGMRGLQVFIADIRNCANREAERLRVDKELANIRTRFKSDRHLTPYEKKKYVWKMLYIYMLGYDVDFGHMEAMALISAPKYAEKQVGYIVTSSLLNENHDFLRLIINTVRNDIISRNEIAQCLALTLVGNVGGKEFSESLAPDVQKLLVSTSVRNVVRKKAALCLLRLYRKNPDVVNNDGWSEKMASLLEDRDLGVLTALMSLLVALVAGNPEGFWPCVSKCVRILERLTRGQDIPQEYTYYGIPSPWLQVKTMRVLQYFPTIEDPSIRQSLFDVLHRILLNTDSVKNVNKNNAAHAVLFEALALVMHLDADKDMMSQCASLLGKFIAVREPNIRYLGLENMARMLLVTDVQESLQKHQAQIVMSLRDPDISIRRRALDLLYGMCDVNNAKEIVEELLQYLTTADFAIREELALKAAILAEKFAPDLSWYVDVILQLIEKAGDFVSDGIWHRVVQFVTNNEDLQAYAALKVKSYVDKPAVHETLVKAAGYILGEYSHLLVHQPGCSSLEIFALLNDKFPTVSTPTKALLLSAYIKILLHTQPPDPQLQGAVMAVFTKHESFMDAEVQQRAVEYAVLGKRGTAMADILAEMPKFPERESALIKKVEDTEGDAPEQSATKIRAQQITSQALVLTQPTNGTLPGTLRRPLPTPAPVVAPVEDKSVEAPVTDGEPPSDSLLQLEPAAPPPPPEPPVVKPPNPLEELLALEAPPGSMASPPPSSPPQNIPGTDIVPPTAEVDALALAIYDTQAGAVQPIGSITEWFQGLVFKDSGIFYEDPFLQVGVKADWKGSQGRFVLYIGNKDTAAITGIQGTVGPTASFRLQLAIVPSSIPPRAQVQVPLDVAAIQVPREVPILDFSYNTPSNQTVSLRLRLPVVLSKFLQPAAIAAQDFFSRWKSLAGPPQKQQEVLRGVKALPLPAMAQLLNSLHIGVAPNLDPNPNNLVAAATLFTETSAPLLVLVRIETDPADRTQLRLTVGCQDPTATIGLKDFIKEQLSDQPPTTGLPPPLLQLPAPPGIAGLL